MDSTSTLFSIVLRCDYYRDGIVKGIKIYPDSNSKNLFKRYNLSFIEKNGHYDLIWFTKKIQNTTVCINNLFKDVQFKFLLQIENLDVFNFLNIQHNKIYNFVNNPENSHLHKNIYVSDIDFSDLNEYADKLFGFITVDMNILLQQNKIFTFETIYDINIQSVESFWEINFFDKKKQIKNFDSFFINEKKCDFEQIDSTYDFSFLSKNAIKLREVGINSLSCVYTTTMNEKKSVYISTPIRYNKILDNGRHISIVDVNM